MNMGRRAFLEVSSPFTSTTVSKKLQVLDWRTLGLSIVAAPELNDPVTGIVGRRDNGCGTCCIRASDCGARKEPYVPHLARERPQAHGGRRHFWDPRPPRALMDSDDLDCVWPRPVTSEAMISTSGANLRCVWWRPSVSVFGIQCFVALWHYSKRE
jgi:hypothetical protein